MTLSFNESLDSPAPDPVDESARAAALLDAQAKAEELFTAVSDSLIRPGITERALSDEIHDLAGEMFGVTRHWHKRIVRAGPNTLHPYDDNPPDLMLRDDEILFLDFGPIFEEWEADFGRTFVLGDDPEKLRLRDSLAPAFEAGKAHFAAHPDITGAQLYSYAQQLALVAGYEFGGWLAGHLVGEFPHERVVGDKIRYYITDGNVHVMRDVDVLGRQLHWILEIHFVDRAREIGGFYEQLLSI